HRTLLPSASIAAANFGCQISKSGPSRQPHAFPAPGACGQFLPQSEIRRIGVGKNPSLRFGTAAVEDCAAHLVQEQIEPIGVGKPGGKTYTPSFFSILDGKRIALLAITDVGPAAGHQIAAASDRSGLSAAIANARSHANLVV